MPSHRFLLASLIFTGCASTTLPSLHEPTDHARVELASLHADDTVRLVPQAIEPALPSADRIAHVIRARLGSEASVDVHYCVSATGAVTDAELERSSDLDAFDRAVMADLRAWHFEAQPGPSSAQTCDRATILYRPHG